jgi:hypothetical protein
MKQVTVSFAIVMGAGPPAAIHAEVKKDFVVTFLIPVR